MYGLQLSICIIVYVLFNRNEKGQNHFVDPSMKDFSSQYSTGFHEDKLQK